MTDMDKSDDTPSSPLPGYASRKARTSRRAARTTRKPHPSSPALFAMIAGFIYLAKRSDRIMSNVVAEHLTAKALKVTMVMDPNQVVNIPTPEGKPRCMIRVSVAGRVVTADLNAKSVRKAIATIREAGPDNVACILQGKLLADNSIAEAGLAAQLKTPKPAEAPAAG